MMQLTLEAGLDKSTAQLDPGILNGFWQQYGLGIYSINHCLKRCLNISQKDRITTHRLEIQCRACSAGIVHSG